MTKKQEIKLFEEKKVRSVWDDEQEKWYFCVVDVVEVLTESVNPTDYIKKIKKRDPFLAQGWGQIVTPLSIPTPGGKQRVNCATAEGIFRLIQSIPSPKAFPLLKPATTCCPKIQTKQKQTISPLTASFASLYSASSQMIFPCFEGMVRGEARS